MKPLKIVNGLVINFENLKLEQKDILLENGKIVAVGEDLPTAANVIDAKGLVVSPGFIDVHMHEEDRGIVKDGEYDISLPMVRMGVTTAVGGNCGHNKASREKFLKHMEDFGSPINYMLAVGYNDIRDGVGVPHNAAPTPEQMKKMQEEIKTWIDNGAIGVSFGIEYTPSITTEEILEVLKPWYDRKDLLLSAHYRSDGPNAVESVEEMCEIGKITGIPFEISHISSCSAFGNMEEALSVVEKYRSEGIDITVDAYPYGAFSTRIGSEVFAPGCFERWGVGYDKVVLKGEPYLNVALTEEIYQDARENHPDLLAIAHVMREEDVKYSLTKPYVMVASDGLYSHREGHPRGAGTFPRVLGQYVREEGVLSLEDALYKMTLQPAMRLRIDDVKGKIEPGYDGDLVIFDPETIIDTATFEKGQLPPVGISHVLINGEIIVEGTELTGIKNGVFIKRS